MTSHFSSSTPLGIKQSLAISIAWAAATAIALLATNLILRALPAEFDAWVVFVGAPILLGVFQWMVLQRLLPHAWWWLPLMAIGSGLGWVCGFGFLFAVSFLANTLDPDAYFPLSWLWEFFFMGLVAAAGGVGIGFIQWLYLRRYVRRAAWWLLASAIALGMGAGANVSAGFGSAFSSGHNWLLSLSVGGLIGGGIKGATLAWLLQEKRSPIIASEARKP